MLDGSWQAAADAWRDRGLPHWEALALGRAPELDSARRSLSLLDSLGATAVRAAVVRDRHAAGLPVPRGSRAGAAAGPAGTTSGPASGPASGPGLTPRELEVLALLVDGLPDAAIATALVLSPKTVGHHVSSVLRKLEVPTRSRAAAEAHRRGLLQDPDARP